MQTTVPIRLAGLARSDRGRRSRLRIARICSALVLALGLCTGALASAAAQRTVLVLGDSISAAYGIQREAGWVARLQERLVNEAPGWQVINASVSGETTGGGLARLPEALATHDPAIVVVELGGNDALRGYPLADIRENLAALVQTVLDTHRRVLLVGMQIPPNYGPRYSQGFAALYGEVAKSLEVPLVPFLLEQVALVPGMVQADGIHPTAAAQPLLLDTLWPYLAPLL